MILAGRHRFAARAEVGLTEREGEQFIANPKSYNLRVLTRSWCREAGFEPEAKAEVTEYSTIREFVSGRIGVAIIPIGVRPIDGLAEVELRGLADVRGTALVPAVQRPSRVVRRLRGFIVERAEL